MDRLPVFVYGTLRRGQCNHRVIEASLDGVRDARLAGHVLYASGLPWIAPGDPASTVTGDLLLISPDRYADGLRALDRLEGYRPPHSCMYVRTLVRAAFRPAPDGPWTDCDAWAYLGGKTFPADPRLAVASGDWTSPRRAA
jgi:gamma-glutamylcyclotransferase (GGCT)/AIG2-like uncharacterized protein YtfP